MPGKYSHSVVLAQYSSQGIISLPNEQHIAYLTSSAPYIEAERHRSASRNNSLANDADRRRQPAKFPSGRQSAMSMASVNSSRQFIVGAGPERVYINGGLSRQQVVPAAAQSSRPSSQSERRAEIRGGFYGTVTVPAPFKTEGPRPTTPNMRMTNTSATATHIATTTASATLEKGRSLVSGPEPESEPRSKSALGATFSIYPKMSPTPMPGPPPVCRPQGPAPTVNSLPTPATPKLAAPHTERKAVHERSSSELHRQMSDRTVTTQVFNPVEAAAAEPDFEGFSDAEDPRDSYLDAVPSPTVHRQSNRRNETIAPTRAVATPDAPIQLRQPPFRAIHTSSSARSETNHSFTPESAAGKLDSLTSVSSIDSWLSNHAQGHQKPADSRKSSVRSPVPTWRLPEISEHNTFGPDLFEQDPTDHVKPISRELGYGESALGMISSGRNVNFHGSDADTVSLASAAFPPDIGRHRDEADKAASKSRLALTGIQPISTVPFEERIVTPEAFANTKRGFFSRLRNKTMMRTY